MTPTVDFRPGQNTPFPDGFTFMSRQGWTKTLDCSIRCECCGRRRRCTFAAAEGRVLTQRFTKGHGFGPLAWVGVKKNDLICVACDKELVAMDQQELFTSKGGV